ncbi:hypothetical protein BCR59_13660 [Klebsiella pneumoniae]|nr:hypothetical protein BCR59_13660 [Klebsiella pneumoniae]
MKRLLELFDRTRPNQWSGNQNDAFTAATLLKPATNNFLGQPRALLDIGRLFSAIHVCCINEIDTRLKRLIQNAGAGLLVVTSPKFMVPRQRRLTFRPVRPRCV